MNGINKFGWLPCTRQGMLTEVLAPNPTGKLNISSVITPLHLLNSLISTMNSVSILLLLWVVGEWDRWAVVDSQQGVGGTTAGGYYLIVFLCIFLLVSHVLSLFKWLEHDSCCVCFFVYYLFPRLPLQVLRSICQSKLYDTFFSTVLFPSYSMLLLSLSI